MHHSRLALLLLLLTWLLLTWTAPLLLQAQESIFSSKDEPEDGGWGFLRSWGSFLVFWF